MRGSLRRCRTLIGLPVVVALTLWAGIAGAAVSVPTPHGWVHPRRAPLAERVRAWADAVQGRVDTIATTRDPDGYAEIIAVIDVPGPIPSAALAPSPESDTARSETLRTAASRMFGFDAAPQRTGTVDLGVGPPLLRGRWTVDAEAYFLALAPTDQSHSAIIMVVEADTAVLYESVFDRLLVDVDGLQSPRQPFPRARWIWWGVLGWIVAAPVVIFVIARFALHLRAAAVGARAAMVLASASLVVAIVVFVGTAEDQGALALAGISRARLAVEVAGPGALLAGLTAGLGIAIARRRAVVPSAPSGGSFAPQPVSTADHPIQTRPPPAPQAGMLPSPSPEPPRMEITAKRPTGELPANLETAAELDVDQAPRGVPVADAPGLLKAAPIVERTGVPKAVPAPLDLTGPASLHTEQILIERGGASKTTKRRLDDDDAS